MKPTKLQAEVIRAVADEIRFWETTNDINSPSHYTSIDNDMLANVMEDMSDADREAVESACAFLFNAIRKLK